MRVMETALSADVLALLEASGLPTEDLRAGRPITLLAATLDGELLGCVGYESSRDVVLLRSLAIRPMSQGRGLGGTWLRNWSGMPERRAAGRCSFSRPRQRRSSGSLAMSASRAMQHLDSSPRRRSSVDCAQAQPS